MGRSQRKQTYLRVKIFKIVFFWHKTEVSEIMGLGKKPVLYASEPYNML